MFTKYQRLLSRKDFYFSKTIEFYRLLSSPRSFGQNTSGALYSWKESLFYLFERANCPPMMNMTPGMTKQQPIGVSPDMISQSPRACITKELTIVFMLVAILITSSLNICATKIWLIMIKNPRIVPTQNMCTKFWCVKIPKIPYLGSKEKTVPPKKYPKVIRLKALKRLQKNMYVKRGMPGTFMFWSMYTEQIEAMIAQPSPRTNLFQGQVLRQRRVWWSIMMGRVMESVQTRTMPIKVRRHPAIQNSWTFYPFFILISTTKKTFRLLRQRAWFMDVNLHAQMRNPNQILKWIVLMKMGLSFQTVKKQLSFSVQFLAVLCSNIRNGIRQPAITRNLHPFLVKNYILPLPLMTQHGMLATRSTERSSKPHAHQELISIWVSRVFSSSQSSSSWLQRLTLPSSLINLSPRGLSSSK